MAARYRLHAYGRSAGSWLVGTLPDLTDEVLDREVDMSRVGLGTWTARRLYGLHGVHHVYMHGGEIACLEGLQGAKGYLGGIDAV